jgi:hypothetical protein
VRPTKGDHTDRTPPGVTVIGTAGESNQDYRRSLGVVAGPGAIPELIELNGDPAQA